MGAIMKSRVSMVLVLLAAVSALAWAGDSYTLKSHSMKIDGTSTLHDWTTPVEKIKAKAEVAVVNNEITNVNSMWVECDVMSITSEKGETMMEKIQEAFKAEDGYKTITFTLSGITDIKKVGSATTITADGYLAMAGQKKPITMTVTGSVMGTDIVFKGEQKLKMTAWGMERPSAMLGAIKAGDEVKVSFTLTMKKS